MRIDENVLYTVYKNKRNQTKLGRKNYIRKGTHENLGADHVSAYVPQPVRPPPRGKDRQFWH